MHQTDTSVMSESPSNTLIGRRKTARQLREDAANNAFEQPRPDQQANDDEIRFNDFRASFHKSLPQDENGFVDPEAFRYLVRALESGDASAFQAIPQSKQIDEEDQRDLANPQAALAFTLEGPDPSAVSIPPAPGYSSLETGIEMTELYWMSLTRDVPFVEYNSAPRINEAEEELQEGIDKLRDSGEDFSYGFRSLFRGNVLGSDVGPFVPQFYLRESPFNAVSVDPRIQALKEDQDYVITFEDWLEVQRGLDTSGEAQFASGERLMHTLRDMASYVRLDRLVQSYLFAAQQLFAPTGS